MKIIDLLNKIANGEEVPKKIKYNNNIWNYKEGIMEYISDDTCFALSNFEFDVLNDEVEILEEEKKIPEKLGECAYVDGEIAYSWSKSEAILKTRINEIIDYLKNKCQSPKMYDEIIKKYKEKINEIYLYQDDNEIAHGKRDNIYRELIEELGYKELVELLEKAEKDIGFWYA